MPDRVSLVRWRPVTDPPKDEGDYPTDAGIMFYDTGFGWQYDESGAPSVWCDPSPPGDDALTVTDLRNIAAAVSIAAHLTRSSLDATTFTALAGRLHRAIEEAER